VDAIARRTSAASTRKQTDGGVPTFGPDSPVKRLLAQADWAASALGPTREWPPELRAGHLPALLAGPDERVRLLDQALSIPLALRPGVPRPEAKTSLPEGSALLLYTDGLVERRGEVLDVGIQRARDALAPVRDLAPGQAANRLAQSPLDGTHSDDAAFLLFSNRRTAHRLGRAKPL
jgi:hypothetical protein